MEEIRRALEHVPKPYGSDEACLNFSQNQNDQGWKCVPCDTGRMPSRKQAMQHCAGAAHRKKMDAATRAYRTARDVLENRIVIKEDTVAKTAMAVLQVTTSNAIVRKYVHRESLIEMESPLRDILLAAGPGEIICIDGHREESYIDLFAFDRTDDEDFDPAAQHCIDVVDEILGNKERVFVPDTDDRGGFGPETIVMHFQNFC